MLDVHGITVSGPTFPAQIWHSYMTTAIGSQPNVSFAPAKTQPVWTSWRGKYEYSGSYGTPTTTAGTTTTTTGRNTTATAPSPKTSVTVTTPPPAPPTVAPPLTVPPAATTSGQ